MTQAELSVIVESQNPRIKEFTGLRFLRNDQGEIVWSLSQCGQHWTGVLVLGGKKNSDGVPMFYIEEVSSTTTPAKYAHLRDRMIKAYLRAESTGIWEPLAGSSPALAKT